MIVLRIQKKSVSELEDQAIEITQSRKQFYSNLLIKGHGYKRPEGIMEYSFFNPSQILWNRQAW